MPSTGYRLWDQSWCKFLLLFSSANKFLIMEAFTLKHQANWLWMAQTWAHMCAPVLGPVPPCTHARLSLTERASNAKKDCFLQCVVNTCVAGADSTWPGPRWVLVWRYYRAKEDGEQMLKRGQPWAGTSLIFSSYPGGGAIHCTKPGPRWELAWSPPPLCTDTQLWLHKAHGLLKPGAKKGH